MQLGENSPRAPSRAGRRPPPPPAGTSTDERLSSCKSDPMAVLLPLLSDEGAQHSTAHIVGRQVVNKREGGVVHGAAPVLIGPRPNARGASSAPAPATPSLLDLLIPSLERGNSAFLSLDGDFCAPAVRGERHFRE